MTCFLRELRKKLKKLNPLGVNVPFKKDRHVLELAIIGNADYVVTLDSDDLINKRQLIESWARSQHVHFKILRPKEFVEAAK